MFGAGIIEIDLHGCNQEQAKAKIDEQIRKAGTSTYRIRCIHGYHGGVRIRNMILDEYGYQREPRVIRITPGENEGITDLVLREL